MPAAPRPSNEPQRLRAIEDLDVLDTPPEEGFDRITRLACELFKVPIAAVSIVAEDRQFFKSIQGLDCRETPRDQAFCAYTILGDEVMHTEDAVCDARFADNPLVTGAPGIRFYAGHPLRLPNGLCVGSLCVIGHDTRTLSPDEARLLKELAGVVVDTLVHRQIARDAVVAAQAKATFLASIGHEIRTPMTAILGFSEIATDPTCTPEERAEMLAGIHRNGQHLVRLINDLLDFAGAESGKLTIRRAPASPVQIVRDVVTTLTPRARDRGISLRPQLDIAEQLLANTDHSRLRQVLLNTIGTAISLAGGDRIEIQAGTMPGDERALLVITVTIPDPQFTAADVARLFEPFCDRADDPGRGGLGLGLALSRRISRLLGGELEVVSSAAGAAFRITLRADPITCATTQPVRLAG